MRSLEKVAKQNGLVKPETTIKTASFTEKPDFSPSANLIENILTLCAGLKEAGMEKYADELQIKFLDFKYAENLYNTSKEKGEDLVDEAHPKGSHSVEGIDGDAVVETILDQQLAMLKMIEKKPTGKLSSASGTKDIIKAVKFVLAEGEPAVLDNDAKVEQIKRLAAEAFKVYVSQGGGNSSSAHLFANLVPKKPLSPTAIKVAMGAVATANAALVYTDKKEESAINVPGYVAPAKVNTTSYDAWRLIEQKLMAISGLLTDLSKTVTSDFDLVSKLDGLGRKLNSMRAFLQNRGFTDKDRKSGNAWIAEELAEVENLKNVLSQMDPETKSQMISKLTVTYNQLENEVNQFFKQLTE
jgi:hypothetical protein